MSRNRVLPETAELLRLRDQEGQSYQQIADRYGVTKGAVHLSLRSAGETGRPKRYAEWIPWRVAAEHDKALAVTMLRLWARAQIGDSGDAAAQRRLDRWTATLRERDLVVHYDAGIPPNPASRKGGFAYVPRRAGIDTFPLSNPSFPREQVAPVQCAFCAERDDLQLLQATLGSGEVVAAICGTHRAMLVVAGQKQRKRGLAWAAG
jgi:hypothetical protein